MADGMSARRPARFASQFPAPLRRAMALVLALPFVLLSLLAQGTMVAAGPTPDSFMVVLCGDHRPVEMVLDDSGDLVPIDESRHASVHPAAGGAGL
jgi:hypothetical protein